VTLLLTRTDVAGLLPMADCIAAVEAAFRAQADAVVPPSVLGLHLPGGGLHIKAAGLAGARPYVAVKINANFPANPRNGLPTIQGLIALFDGGDGRVLALMDSIEVTALRTGAATAAAARVLSRRDAGDVALAGCGMQAGYQLAALAQVRMLRSVVVHDRDRDGAARFAARAGAALGVPVSVADRWPEAARSADIVVTCTTSHAPILGPEDVGPGAFVAAVGADNPEKHEIAPGLLARGRVFTDSTAQAAAIGDLHHAIVAGVQTTHDVEAELWEVLAGRKRGRASDDEITIFDSTGVAVEDVAAAALVYERAAAAGRCTEVELGA
jgi:ornithine cyclodeaminase/alanine dehydrogenase-like protein (mu-crystallin family)